MPAVYTFTDLMKLWASHGGNPFAAPIAAAIAMAESGGDPNAVFDETGAGNRALSTDYGLWQINDKHYGGGMGDLDPITNVKKAIQISKNGTDWRAWCTAYSDNHCGARGGTYLGTGANAVRILKANGGGSYMGTVPPGGANNPRPKNGKGSNLGGGNSGGGGGGSSGGTSGAKSATGVAWDPLSINSAMDKAGRYVMWFVAALGGVALFWTGIILLVMWLRGDSPKTLISYTRAKVGGGNADS